MADDKQHDDSVPDPWGDLLSGGAEEPASEFAFSFDEPAAAEPEAAVPVEPPAAAEQHLDDGLVDAWLDDGDPVVGDTAEAAPPPGDAAGSSTIEIGTGRSGIVDAGEADAWDDVGRDDQPSGDAATSGDTFSFDDPAPAEALAEEATPLMADAGLEEAAGAAVGAVAAAAGAGARTPGKARKAASAKKSGIGQVIGVVLGGAMAIPITMAILIWGFQKDPFKVAKYVPESVAFLLPQKFQPGFKKLSTTPRVPDGPTVEPDATGSPLDALGGMPLPGDGGSATETGTGGEDLPGSAPPEPGDDENVAEPVVATAEPVIAPVDNLRVKAELDRLAAEAAAEAAKAERQPLEAAVADAVEAVNALEAVADPDDPVRKKLLVDLYKSLAKAGTELVMLERISADAGRPLAAAPASLDELHDRLAAHRDDLVRLGRNWLDFAKRPSDGVILPVTFQSSRKIGPYWSSKVTLPQAKEGVREIVVLSRAEPAAVAGDEVVVTGMVFDGGVIWAADVRQVRAGRGQIGGGFGTF